MAVTILMIAVAGPLVVATKGLTAALYAKDQMIATFLAQESMEVIKNIRDNNLATSQNWLEGLATCNGLDKVCDASALEPTVLINSCQSNCNLDGADKGHKIFFNNGYRRDANGATPTIFRRYFYLVDSSADGVAQPNNYTVTVVVTWKAGQVNNEVRLSSEITSTLR